ncbi:hypothetical protein [Mucilaginibacter sp. KACC 22063]|uniref:hypothetical protein n=1 Tax=Mucilaginibacter sp. KACC 22063 TaxID=3025666 RepID=UPI0023668570|nr:hypothetical protein [Mucilaginibacter sp. KACC 22063]WDF53628.1 hypothetical protein PQ461_11800 [Mucilaginibacter sp. KACC 22063]
MKKLILTAAVAVTMSTGAFAVESTKNTSNSNKVSYQVLNQFDSQFADAENVTWSATANGQKADFVIDDVKMTAFYDNRGQFLGTTQAIAYKKLSTSARKEIAAKYPGYEVGEIIKYENNDPSYSSLDRLTIGDNGPVNYFVDLKNDKEEILVRVSPNANIYFYKQIK